MTILIAYDGSKPAQKAVDHAIAEHPDKEIILLRVVEVAGGATSAGFNLIREMLKEREETDVPEVPSKIKDKLDDAGIEFEIEIVYGEPTEEIVEFANENDIEQILIGNHGQSGVSRVLLGSVAEKVVRRAPIPVRSTSAPARRSNSPCKCATPAPPRPMTW
jgi:nucleotide-binding universal stress UspA family protein